VLLFRRCVPTCRRNIKPPSSVWKRDVPPKRWYPSTDRTTRSHNSDHHGMDLYRHICYLCVAYLMALSVSHVKQHRILGRSVNDSERSGRGPFWDSCQEGLWGRQRETSASIPAEVQTGHLLHTSTKLYSCSFMALVDRSNQLMLTLKQGTYTINRLCQNVTSLLM
jgi:hypothetical protein